MNEICHRENAGQDDGAFLVKSRLHIVHVASRVKSKVNIHAPADGLVDNGKENEEDGDSAQCREAIEEGTVANAAQAQNNQQVDWN